MEDGLEEDVEEAIEVEVKHFISLSDEEHEIEVHEEEGDDLDAPLDDGEIENYCRKFVDFMLYSFQLMCSWNEPISKLQYCIHQGIYNSLFSFDVSELLVL